MDKSMRMSIYNKAKAAARQGKLDPARTNKAFGMLQSADGGAGKFQQYRTTTKTCNCPDHARTGKPCKHMIARMIQVRGAPQVVKPVSTVYVCTNGDIMMCEQKVNSYTCHYFRTEQHFQEYAKYHPTMRFVHPTKAHGKREYSDVNHTQEYI